MKKRKLYYEIFMSILAVLSVVSIWKDENIWLTIDKVVWLIFFIDITIRIINSKNKLQYIKKYPFDIIAVIPLDSAFLLARLARLFRVIRLVATFNRLPFFKVLKTNSLDKVIVATFLLIFLSAIPIKLVEPSIATYQDALWWAVVTATTVGYGDISPVTGTGRIIALLLMIFGIGLIGMITGSVATFFLSRNDRKESTAIQFIKKELDRNDEWTANDIDTIILLLEKIKKEKEGPL